MMNFIRPRLRKPVGIAEHLFRLAQVRSERDDVGPAISAAA